MMRIEAVKITPAMAREWLAVDPDRNQRTLKKRNLARLREALDNNEWRLTHQPIALDPTGYVLDGRHRLTAIAGQRKHVTCLVAYDADPESFDVIDVGATRTPGDSLKIAGYTDVNVLAATARIVRSFPAVVGTSNTVQAIGHNTTSRELLETVNDPETGKIIRDSLRPGQRIAFGIGRQGYRSSATALVALVRLWSDVGEDTQEEFFERMATGAGLDTDSPILGFRRWVITDTGYARTPGWVRQTAALCVSIRAWNDYVNGRERSIIRYRPGVDLMPEID